MSNSTNSDRSNISNALYSRNKFSIYKCRAYTKRCNVWMINTLYACKWSRVLFYICVFTYRTWVILWVIYETKNSSMISRSDNIFFNDGDSVYRICITILTNELLSSDSNNKFNVSYTMNRGRFSGVYMRRI
eukprot:NODE_48_length_27236_cov_0.507573.p6 type:complete len:132 gc:universal NODE_48_length_27236_cov_0.507573:18626-19021(+)